jgi:serine/threonine protein kinase
METPAKRVTVPDPKQSFMSPIPEDKEKQLPKNGSYAGPYRLLDCLGKGGLATVKVGIHCSTGRKVAVKIVDKTKLANPREQVSMAREITIMKLLRHPNILRLYDVHENSEKIFLVLELYEGGDLYGHLTKNGAMRPSEAVVLFRQIIQGVEFCHKNLIVHRDLKPENLLLSSDKKNLVLSDFGLSTGMAGSRNFLKTRCGTVHYISPEVAKGELYVGMSSDVWSCGIILFAMVTASLPFDGESSVIVLKKIVKGEFNMPAYLPTELKDLIRKMLNVNPSQRITIPDIKKHPWYKLGASKEDMEEPVLSIEPFNVTLDEIQSDKPMLDNLKLLGWEESQLIDDLLAKEMNQAKIFYKYLNEHKHNKIQSPKPAPPKAPSSEEKQRRRASDGRARSHGTSVKTNTRSRSRSRSRSREKVKEKDINIDTDESVSENKENETSTPSVHDKKAASGKILQNVRSVVSSDDTNATVNPPFTRSKTPRQRAATLGERTRPNLNGSDGRSRWGISPTQDPSAKMYSVESKMSISQILDNLRLCFNGLELEFTEKKNRRTL